MVFLPVLEGKLFFCANMRNLIILILALFGINDHAFASVIISNGLTHNLDVSSKSIKEGKVLLKNIGEKPQAIKVYFNDLTSDCKGKIDYVKAGENLRSLYPYVNVNNTDYTLQPGEEYELSYRIDLTKNEFDNGSLWVLLMVEVVDPVSKTTTEQGFEIGSKIRYAVQLIANIGQKNAEAISFSNVKIAKDINELRVLEASIENGGRFMAIPNVNIQIFDEKGLKVKDLSVPSKKIYPQNCQSFSLPLADLPKGKYQAVLLAEYLEESIGVNIDLEI